MSRQYEFHHKLVSCLVNQIGLGISQKR